MGKRTGSWFAAWPPWMSVTRWCMARVGRGSTLWPWRPPTLSTSTPAWPAMEAITLASPTSGWRPPALVRLPVLSTLLTSGGCLWLHLKWLLTSVLWNYIVYIVYLDYDILIANITSLHAK